MNDRRLFLQSSAAACLTYVAAESRRATAAESSPSETVVMGLMGVNGRGHAIAKGMLALPNTRIDFIADVDARAAARTADLVEKTQGKRPTVVQDFREILDASRVDAFVCAAPNHWHAPATILACAAGKHVYVEKPCSHNAAEGEMALAAARKYDRVVQMGTQRRSWPAIIQGIEKIHQGVLGPVHYSRTWYNNRRQSIGRGKATVVPDWLNWDQWQGPAPRCEYRDNLVHYNWHWHWKWGNGELGNNGIHGLDVARWALQVTFPFRVTASGGKYRYDDEQQTPDTMMVSFDFPENKTITWEGLSWSPMGPHDSSFGLSVHGDNGTMVFRGNGYTHYDAQGNEVVTQNGAAGDVDHFTDFLDAVRAPRRTNADIEQAHRSTLLCHLGNMAYQHGGALRTDPRNGHVIENETAQAAWGRQYADGWQERLDAS